ncbi:hypothetical protein; putative membrane protein [Bradyrhizobium sp. ORS 278]|nr:hypothetical protein; putative membrane protein [Bradyrhizobium sp. ORS 278]
MDEALWSALRRRSITAFAALGAAANLLCIVLTFHRGYLTSDDFHHGVVAGVWLVLLVGIPLLSPSLALFVFRRFAPVVALLTTLLLSILAMNIDELVRYYETGVFARVMTWDLPGIALLFLSMFTVAMMAVRAIIRLVDRLQGYDPDLSSS